MVVSTENEYVKADIYPFIDDVKQAPFSRRITIMKDGRLLYDGIEMSKEKAQEFIERLSKGFSEAFKFMAIELPPKPDTSFLQPVTQSETLTGA